MKRARSTTTAATTAAAATATASTTSEEQTFEFLKQHTLYYDQLESIESAMKKQKTEHKKTLKEFEEISIKLQKDKDSLEDDRAKYLYKVKDDLHFDDWWLVTSDQLTTLANDQLTYLVLQRYHYDHTMPYKEPNFLYYPTRYEKRTKIEEDIDTDTDKMTKFVDSRGFLIQDMLGIEYWDTQKGALLIRTPEQRRAIEIHWLTKHCCDICGNVTHRNCDVPCKACGHVGHLIINCDSKIKKLFKRYPKLKQIMEDMPEYDSGHDESEGEDEESEEKKEEDDRKNFTFTWGASNSEKEIKSKTFTFGNSNSEKETGDKHMKAPEIGDKNFLFNNTNSVKIPETKDDGVPRPMSFGGGVKDSGDKTFSFNNTNSTKIPETKDDGEPLEPCFSF